MFTHHCYNDNLKVKVALFRSNIMTSSSNVDNLSYSILSCHVQKRMNNRLQYISLEIPNGFSDIAHKEEFLWINL